MRTGLFLEGDRSRSLRPRVPDLPSGLLRRVDQRGGAPDEKREIHVVEEHRDGGERFLLCAVCGHRITRTKERIQVNGSHEHTFANPHGLVFRIGCFLSAPGCITDTSETTEFTWFAGYAWRIDVCGGCFAHLGWGFRSREHAFHGLVLDRLVEEGTEDAV